MKPIYLFFLLSVLILNGCSSIRESAGVNRKTIDEFKVVENPPLVIPPDFNLLSSDQLTKKNIDNVDKDLAQEILFGLDENASLYTWWIADWFSVVLIFFPEKRDWITLSIFNFSYFKFKVSNEVWLKPVNKEVYVSESLLKKWL